MGDDDVRRVGQAHENEHDQQFPLLEGPGPPDAAQSDADEGDKEKEDEVGYLAGEVGAGIRPLDVQ